MDLLLCFFPAWISSAAFPLFHLLLSPPSSCFELQNVQVIRRKNSKETQLRNFSSCFRLGLGWDFSASMLGLHGSRVVLGMSRSQESLGTNQPQYLPTETGAAAGGEVLPTIVGIPRTFKKPKIPPAGIRVQLQMV